MRWIVIGANGMLGQDLTSRLREDGREVVPLSRGDCDVRDAAACGRVVARADVVVNCAAWTDVDRAEREETSAFAVNAEGAANLARACSQVGARLVHLSTDYVFSGRATEPYRESAPADPMSAYGRSKAAGEAAVRAACQNHLLVRTAWLYGAHGSCFPKTILRLARTRKSLDVVDDQVGQPTWTVDVAEVIMRLVSGAAPAGTYHATAGGRTSWYGFAREVLIAAGLDAGKVAPTTTDAFVRPAPRPAFSVLSHGGLEAAGVEPIGHWRDRWRAAAATVLDV